MYVIGVPDALVGAESVPHAAPEQPTPDTAQLTPLFCGSFATVAVNACVPIPACRLCVAGATLTPIVGTAVTVITAVPLLAPSATEVAVRVTVAGAGTELGAVYVMATPEALEVAETVPHVAPLQPAPAKAQVTPLACASFETFAVKLWGCPVCTEVMFGATLTPTGAVTVIVAVPVLVPSATEVAVKVTVAGLGTLTGAAYVIATPDALDGAERFPQVTPEHPAPESVQFTPLFCASLLTVAVNALVPMPACTLVGVGATKTVIAGGAVTVMVAALDFVVSVTEVAVSVTVAGLGTLTGAVYVIATPEALTAADRVPQDVPVQPVPDKVHVTP